MIIGIDARSLGKKICGVSRVTSCLIKALGQVDQDNSYIIYTDSVTELSDLPANFHLITTRCNRLNFLHDLFFYKFLQDENLDIIHVMHSWLPLFIPKRVKTIVTIHDIFTITDADFFHKRKPFHSIFKLYFLIVTRMTLDRSNVVITITNFCANEIRRIFNVKNKRFEIIHNSPGILPIKNNVHKNTATNYSYLFYLGNFRSYKNVQTLIKGYAHFQKSTKSNVFLVIAGNDDYAVISDLIEQLHMKNHIHFFRRPTDEEVDNLYRNAKAFVFPSLFEGFGIPPLEAMSYGIPVLISNAEALVEISGDAALVFDKTSHEDLANKIEQILNDKELRIKLVQRGYECAGRYTWENSAKQLKAVYESFKENE